MKEITPEQEKEIIGKHKEIILSLIDESKQSLSKGDDSMIKKMILESRAFTGVMAGRYWSYQMNITITPTKELKDEEI